MKNIFSFFRKKDFSLIFKSVFLRFPVSIIISIITTIIFIILSNWFFHSNIQDILIKVNVSLIVCFFLSVWIYLFFDTISKNKIKRSLFQLLILFYWIAFYYSIWQDFFYSDLWFSFFTINLFLIISFLFFSPYLLSFYKNKLNQDIYYKYFYKISIVFFTSTILWWALVFLWFIWISSVFFLFNLGFNEWEIFWYWASISLVFLAPIFWLINIPNDQEIFSEKWFVENKFFSFLVRYIAIPFIYIYFIILYAYSIKVLLNFSDWPKWQVSWMVIWFSVFWYLIYIFSYYFEKTNKLISVFRKTLPYIIFPQLFMLFYAIYLRINQYDLTVNRYFVVLFWVLLFILSIYYIFSKKKYLFFAPFLVTIFSIIILIWPWWVYNFPESRQLVRLESNLMKANILSNWQIIPLEKYSDINKELSNDIYSWIEYLCDFRDCQTIKELFKEKYIELDKKYEENFYKIKKDNLELYKEESSYTRDLKKSQYEWMSKWEIVREITDFIKVKYTYDYESEINSKYINIRSKETHFPINVDWYQTILGLNINDWYFNNDVKDDLNVSFDSELWKLILKSWSWSIIEEINIKSMFNSLYLIYQEKEDSEFDKDDLIFEFNWEKYDYKLFLNYVSISNPEYVKKENDYYNINNSWYVLIRDK